MVVLKQTGCHLEERKDMVASPYSGLRVTAGNWIPSRADPGAKYFLHCGDKNVLPATMRAWHRSHLATAPHLGPEHSCQGHLSCVGTPGLWGLGPGHQSSGACLLLLSLHRKDLPSLCLMASPRADMVRVPHKDLDPAEYSSHELLPTSPDPPNNDTWDSKMGEIMLPPTPLLEGQRP